MSKKSTSINSIACKRAIDSEQNVRQKSIDVDCSEIEATPSPINMISPSFDSWNHVVRLALTNPRHNHVLSKRRQHAYQAKKFD